MTHHDKERRRELVLQYLTEFRKMEDMLDSENFDGIVARNLGMDPKSPEFKAVQNEAEDLIKSELDEWMAEQKSAKNSPCAPEPYGELPVSSCPDHDAFAKREDGEDVQYIMVDFGDMEEDESYDDLVLVDKQLDIQVFHFDDSQQS